MEPKGRSDALVLSGVYLLMLGKTCFSGICRSCWGKEKLLSCLPQFFEIRFCVISSL